MNEWGKTLRFGPGGLAWRARLAPWLGLVLLAGWLTACAGAPATGPTPTGTQRPRSSPTAASPTPRPATLTPVPWSSPTTLPSPSVSPAPSSLATRNTPAPPTTPSPPTSTATPPSSSMATRTPEPQALAPLAQVTGRLYCRTGPGIYYPAVRVLQPGQVVQLAGANKIFYDWWLVLLDDGTTCWAHRGWIAGVSDQAAALLPQVTPPPPPPAAFKPIRHQWPLMVPFCPAFWGPGLQFQVKNLGPEPIRSFEITLTVLDTGAVYRTTTWEGVPTCAKVRTQIPPGETVALAARTRQDLTDKRVRLDLRGCTEPGFRGACVAYSLTWTIEPPPRPAWPRP